MTTIPTPRPSRLARAWRASLIPTLLLCFVAALLFAGCAALDEASVARTDRLPAAPYYKTYRKGSGIPEPAMLLPLEAEPASASRLEPLRAAIDAYLAEQACCRSAPGELPVAGRPGLYVGSAEGENAPLEAWDIREAHEKYPPMIVHYEKPAAPWLGAATTLAAAEGAQRIVITRLDFVQYPKADKGFFGKKVVLGTHHENDVRFFSAIDKPIEVLQLSGVVLDAGGTALCAGAEGIVGSDSPFWVQVLEAGRDIDDELLEQVLHHERREDVPGAPLNWQVAADQLLWNLLRRCS